MACEGGLEGGAAGPCHAHNCFFATVMWFLGDDGSPGSAAVGALVVDVNGEGEEAGWRTSPSFTGTSSGRTRGC